MERRREGEGVTAILGPSLPGLSPSSAYFVNMAAIDFALGPFELFRANLTRRPS